MDMVIHDYSMLIKIQYALNRWVKDMDMVNT